VVSIDDPDGALDLGHFLRAPTGFCYPHTRMTVSC
jgi:hypothetical protein